MLYKKGQIVEILEGQFKGYEAVVKKNIANGCYFLVNPIVDNKIVNLNLTLHVNDLLIRKCYENKGVR